MIIEDKYQTEIKRSRSVNMRGATKFLFVNIQCQTSLDNRNEKCDELKLLKKDEAQKIFPSMSKFAVSERLYLNRTSL
jgi:hypothetical protein